MARRLPRSTAGTQSRPSHCGWDTVPVQCGPCLFQSPVNAWLKERTLTVPKIPAPQGQSLTTSTWDLVTSSLVSWSYSYPTREETTPWFHLSICLPLFPLGSAQNKQLGVPITGPGKGLGHSQVLKRSWGRTAGAASIWWVMLPGLCQEERKESPALWQNVESASSAPRLGGVWHRLAWGCSACQEGLGPGAVPTPPQSNHNTQHQLPQQGGRHGRGRRALGHSLEKGRAQEPGMSARTSAAGWVLQLLCTSTSTLTLCTVPVCRNAFALPLHFCYPGKQQGHGDSEQSEGGTPTASHKHNCNLPIFQLRTESRELLLVAVLTPGSPNVPWVHLLSEGEGGGGLRTKDLTEEPRPHQTNQQSFIVLSSGTKIMTCCSLSGG